MSRAMRSCVGGDNRGCCRKLHFHWFVRANILLRSQYLIVLFIIYAALLDTLDSREAATIWDTVFVVLGND
jgi:hypothetical protein